MHQNDENSKEFKRNGKCTTTSIRHGGRQQWMTARGTGSPAFIDDVSAGKSLNCMVLDSLLRFSQMDLHSASQYKWILPKKPKSVSKQRSGKPFSGQDLISTRQNMLFSYWRKRDQQRSSSWSWLLQRPRGASTGRRQCFGFLTISLKIRASY